MFNFIRWVWYCIRMFSKTLSYAKQPKRTTLCKRNLKVEGVIKSAFLLVTGEKLCLALHLIDIVKVSQDSITSEIVLTVKSDYDARMMSNALLDFLPCPSNQFYLEYSTTEGVYQTARLVNVTPIGRTLHLRLDLHHIPFNF